MNWTSELPKQDGFYWVVEGNFSPSLVHFDEWANDITFARSRHTESITHFKNCQWYGPIIAPDMPKEVK